MLTWGILWIYPFTWPAHAYTDPYATCIQRYHDRKSLLGSCFDHFSSEKLRFVPVQKKHSESTFPLRKTINKNKLKLETARAKLELLTFESKGLAIDWHANLLSHHGSVSKLNSWFEFETANQPRCEPGSLLPKAAMLAIELHSFDDWIFVFNDDMMIDKCHRRSYRKWSKNSIKIIR